MAAGRGERGRPVAVAGAGDAKLKDMTTARPETTIESVEELTALVGEPIQRVRDKVRPALHALDVEWLQASRFCLIATSGADGRCDVSPKGDPAGSLVHVIDERTIAIAERPGNRRVDGYRNVLENPHVGLIFLVPGRAESLRVNGHARLVREAPWFDEMVVKGHRPVLALMVDVEEVFGHCQKAFLRSQLWRPESWRPEAVTPFAVKIRETQWRDATLEEVEAYYGPDYADRLYRG